MAEALALGMPFGLQKERDTRACVEGDSKLVIGAIKGSYSTPWRSKNIIEDIKWLVTSFDSISRIHVLMKVNFLTNVVLSTDFSFSNFHIWDRALPSVARKTFLFDCIGIGFNHGHTL